MKTVELFYLPNCPYCIKAKKAVEDLKAEHEIYSHVPLKWIDESEEEDYADEHDYYYVPAVYYGSKMIFEAHPGDTLEIIKTGIKTAFDKALYENSWIEHMESSNGS